MSGEKARRFEIETCPRCGSRIDKEGGWDGEYTVCTNMECDAYGPHAENPEPIKGVEVAEVSALRKEWDGELEAAIEWPGCPDDHPNASAWIEGRDAAVRAFAAGLNRTMEPREPSPSLEEVYDGLKREWRAEWEEELLGAMRTLLVAWEAKPTNDFDDREYRQGGLDALKEALSPRWLIKQESDRG